ncbi:MAG: ribbon-helix-helix domain-containing protein [Candidatus Bathyarchaeota archaeon]|nr:ribbon-helix-helix domain-containing protein [Candidatus Bathyarchaeota archaeon]
MNDYTTIKLPNEMVDEIDKLVGKHGFRSRGEIVKEAIRNFLMRYPETNVTVGQEA